MLDSEAPVVVVVEIVILWDWRTRDEAFRVVWIACLRLSVADAEV